MAWQGDGGAGASGGPPDDETKLDWAALGDDTAEPPAAPAAPPPGPDTAPTPAPTAAETAPPPVADRAPAPAVLPGYASPATADTPRPDAATAPPPGPPPAPPAADHYPPPGEPYPPAAGYPPPAAPPAPAGSLPPAGAWAPPDQQVAGYAPGTSGLKFGGVLPRFLAWWLDGFILGIGLVIVAGVMGAIMGSTEGATLVSTVVYVGGTFLYFVGMWTGGGQATLGMRLFNLRVGNAADGRTLTMTQAGIRWLALGFWINAATILPAPLSSLLSLGGLVWYLVLLVSTVTSATRQGIHDRVAGSAMVQPVGREGPVMPCLVLFVVLLVVLPTFLIISLIFLGGQVSSILSEVGTSI